MDPETPPAAPPPPDPEMHRLDSRLMPYWLVVNTFTTIVLVAALAAGVFYLRGRYPEQAEWFSLAGYVAAGGLIVLAVAQPILAYVTWRYGMDEQLLVARYGILFREEKTIPISRLQHVDLRRGPIERLFSLATLVVFTAGTEGATFRVPGLSVMRARQMRDWVLAARGDDVI